MKRFTIAIAALIVLAGACSSGSESATATTRAITTDTRPPIQAIPVSYGLQTFDACEDFLDYVKGHAVDLVGPWGFEYGYYGPMMFRDGAFPEALAVEDAATATTAAASGAAENPQLGVDFSGTNLQELGVDEPDIIKTDGRRIVVTSGNVLYIIDTTGEEPRLAGQVTLETGWASDLFLLEDTVLVMGYGDTYATPLVEQDFATDMATEVWYPTPISTLIEIDISNVDDPQIERTLYVDGNKISARMVGNSVRVVVSSAPTGLQFKYPETGGLKAERDAEAYNRQVVLDSTIDNWVPYYVLEDGSGRVVREGSLLDCSQAHHPEEFSGLSMLNVLTIDLDNSLNIDDAVGVLASGDIVYSSTDAMYVASSVWQNWDVLAEDDTAEAISEHTTDIHKFDISDPSRTTYVATGRVTGFMLSQWSMSEYDGNLRVATTSSPDWWWGGDRESESFVTVLDEQEGELVEIGKVGGLGKGERIYSVRFIDDVGYVVTFRQTDPLYTIDLSDPANPTVVGELKILGYSAYLHPVGDGLLLGIGQDATDEGRTLGTQVSLFDVSDLANPERIHNYTLDDGYSSVEYDHRAFLHWPQTGLTVIPVQVWSWDEESEQETGFSGAIAIKATRDGIEEVGRISHGHDQNPEEYWWAPPIERSLIIGDKLYTYSYDGVLESDLETVEPGTFVGLYQ